MSAEFEVLLNRLPELSVEIRRVAGELVRKAAFDIEQDAKMRAPVDTGFLRNSLYVVTRGQSTYDASGDGPMLPEVERPPDELTAYVAPGAEYAIYVEMGTSTNYAQPFLTPAAEFVGPTFTEAMSRLEDAMRERLGEV